MMIFEVLISAVLTFAALIYGTRMGVRVGRNSKKGSYLFSVRQKTLEYGFWKQTGLLLLLTIVIALICVVIARLFPPLSLIIMSIPLFLMWFLKGALFIADDDKFFK
jgi:magnesium-transporting ATPase (P-type)